MKRVMTVWLLVLAMSTAGCFRTEIINGGSSATVPAAGYNNRFNHNAIFGLVNFSGEHELDRICPNGWAKVETRTGFLAGLVNYVLSAAAGVGFLYQPQNVTVYCK